MFELERLSLSILHTMGCTPCVSEPWNLSKTQMGILECQLCQLSLAPFVQRWLRLEGPEAAQRLPLRAHGCLPGTRHI